MFKCDTLLRFTERAIQVHDCLYDYSLMKYRGSSEKVQILCKKHGSFWQRPYDHISNKSGCPTCFGTKKKTTEQFIKESRIIHGFLYNYSLVKYSTNKGKVRIICNIHGLFEQTARYHLKGSGCRKCAKKEKLSIKEFTDRAVAIHNYTYNYSLVKYMNGLSKVQIICKTHGAFEQAPFKHLLGQGCSSCSRVKKLTIEEFIDRSVKVHGNKYYYNNTIYKSCNEKINIICYKHGEFHQYPSDHMNGNGCSKCANNHLSKEEFISLAKKVHKGVFKYMSVDYVNKTTKVNVFCKKHGLFSQTPSSHLAGGKCPKCTNCISNKEIQWLNSMGVQDRNRQISLPGLPQRWKVDGFDPRTKTVYEFYGDYWHGNPDIYNKSHINEVSKKTFGSLYNHTINREKIIKNHGYNLIVIWENVYDTLCKKRLNLDKDK